MWKTLGYTCQHVLFCLLKYGGGWAKFVCTSIIRLGAYATFYHCNYWVILLLSKKNYWVILLTKTWANVKKSFFVSAGIWTFVSHDFHPTSQTTRPHLWVPKTIQHNFPPLPDTKGMLLLSHYHVFMKNSCLCSFYTSS